MSEDERQLGSPQVSDSEGEDDMKSSPVKKRKLSAESSKKSKKSKTIQDSDDEEIKV